MAWYVYIAYLFGGAFLANGVPHFVRGVTGRKFPSPFAHPSGVGLSSPIVNVLWGFLNFIISGLLLQVGTFSLGITLDTLAALIGAFAFSLVLASHFGKNKAIG